MNKKRSLWRHFVEICFIPFVGEIGFEDGYGLMEMGLLSDCGIKFKKLWTLGVATNISCE